MRPAGARHRSSSVARRGALAVAGRSMVEHAAVDVVRPRLARAQAHSRGIAQVGRLVLRGGADGGGGKAAESLVTLARVVTLLDRGGVRVVAVGSGLRKAHGLL